MTDTERDRLVDEIQRLQAELAAANERWWKTVLANCSLADAYMSWLMLARLGDGRARCVNDGPAVGGIEQDFDEYGTMAGEITLTGPAWTRRSPATIALMIYRYATRFGVVLAGPAFEPGGDL